MSSSSSSDTTTIRYAPYVENKHDDFLTNVQAWRVSMIPRWPYDDYEDVVIDSGFFGAGYVISNFPSLYDMYGKFMAGLDIETLWSQNFEDTVNPPPVSNLVSAEAALLDDDIQTRVLPEFLTGMRDINSVMSSSFVIGKAVIEDARVKALSKFSAELKYRLIPVAQDRWARHLEWNRAVVTTYSEMMRLYFSAKMDIDEVNYSMKVRNYLWPFTILEYERAALGALQGAITTTTDSAGASKATKALGGAASGAMVGSEINTPYGTVIGGVLGAAAGYFS